MAIDDGLPEFGWTLTVTADHAVVVQARRNAWALAGLAMVALLLGTLVWRQRERRLTEQRAASAQLETRVQERTQRAAGSPCLPQGDGRLAAGGHACA